MHDIDTVLDLVAVDAVPVPPPASEALRDEPDATVLFTKN